MTERMLHIGTLSAPAARRHADYTQEALRRIGVESDIVVAQNLHDLEAALLHGAVQLAAHCLSDLPTALPDGLVVTAVSAREHPGDLLLMRPEAVDSGQDFGVKPRAVLGGGTPWRIAQMRDFRPDIAFKHSGEGMSALLENLRQGALDAVLVAAADLHLSGLDASGLEALPLHPSEFVPAPAQGVLAYQTHRDDLTVRRILKQLHHSEVSACTNVERRVLQLLGGDQTLPLGVFVERDAAGNFHAFAALEQAGTMCRVRLSQNTNVDLAEQVVRALEQSGAVPLSQHRS